MEARASRGSVRIFVLAVGKPKTLQLASAIAEYEARIAHYFKFAAREVRPLRLPPGGDMDTVATQESEALLAHVPPGLEVVAVDERGEAWSSKALADYLRDMAVLSRPGVAFLLGGPAGLSPELRRSASKVLSLSSYTLPHELARLVLVEQIYRAGTILRGEPYHKGG